MLLTYKLVKRNSTIQEHKTKEPQINHEFNIKHTMILTLFETQSKDLQVALIEHAMIYFIFIRNEFLSNNNPASIDDHHGKNQRY
jgi:hypothetical protein